MKILTVVGARPQFIKAAPVSRAFRNADIQEYLVHTGQHYDYGMSKIFFDEMRIPEPNINLAVGSGSHGYQTGTMLIHIEEVMIKEKPDLVLVYGDTNSTIAGALAAVKLHIPVAHVEAGGRSFNREMPEEHNRVLTDHCSEYLFCPTRSFVEHLRREGITRNVYFVGDVMYDAVLQFTEIANRKSTILQDLRVQPKEYLLATVHRPSNTDNPANLEALLAAFESVQMPVIFPVHPRTYDKITALSWRPAPNSNLRMVDPVGYLDMLVLEQNAHRILTDSGGIQKEAYFFKVPCLTLRKDTGWMDLVDVGWNVLVGADKSNIITQVLRTDWPTETEMFFGDGDASEKIASILSQEIDISS